jgi:hypothetical protein
MLKITKQISFLISPLSLIIQIFLIPVSLRPVFAQELILPGNNNQVPYPAQSFGTPDINFSTSSIGYIIFQLLKYIFIFAGLAMLLYLVWGGFDLMTSSGDPKKIDVGKGKVTNALIGFLIIFASYFLIQILQVIFNLHIVS